MGMVRTLAAGAAISIAMLGGCKGRAPPPEESVNGFIEVVMPDGAKDDTVLIFAPPNCPRESAQRARELHEFLVQKEIPATMTNRYSLRYTDNSEAFRAKLQRTAGVMEGDIPIVIINGWGKSNPTPTQVAAEYERTTRGKS
jgi:hypothetical protein